jgi:capsular exopolysaccharide synthesis family protein
LLVDADLRRPMIEESLSGRKNGSAGFTDFLRGHKKLNEICLAHETIANLFWLGGGSAVQDPGELVARADFQQLLDEALPHYDRIVIDSAPLLPVSDTLHLASRAQTVVLVVQGCKTSRQGVERSVRLLQGADARIAGVVLNLLPNRLFGGYYYSYYNGNGDEATVGKQNGRSPVNA